MSLSDDIIWSIFMLNASDSSDQMEKRLTTTRFSSQVCRRWRSLIIESPSMWGRLILISYRQKEEWVEEVLKRAGRSSVLWVNVHWFPSTDSNHNLPSSFVVICNRYWDRVQVLDVVISTGSEVKDGSGQKFWTLMARPAPLLRSAMILTSGWNTISDRRLPEDMFGNCAPLLTRMEFQTHRIFHNHTFLSQIDTLCFRPDSIDNLHDILRWTPRLRILRISRLKLNRSSDDECSKLASMSPHILPRLAMIDAILSFQEFNALWCTRSKSPADTFTHHSIACRTTQIDMEEGKFREAVGNLFEHHSGVTSDVDDMEMSLSIVMRNLYINVRSTLLQSKLSFAIINLPLEMLENALDCFMAHAGNVRQFGLSLTTVHEQLAKLEQSCLLLTKVQTLSVGSNALRWYNKVNIPKGLLFPQLDTLLWERQNIQDEDIKDLAEFLQTRVEAGRSLPTVSIKSYNNMEYICNALNKFHGLRITWCFDVNSRTTPVREYVCGKSEALEW